MNFPLKQPQETCPECRELSFTVIRSRITGDGRRRRKACSNCKYRETTYEVKQVFYKQAKKDSEALRRVRAALGLGTVETSEIVERSCLMCIYMTQTECSFGFPEAGDEFASECLHYEERT